MKGTDLLFRAFTRIHRERSDVFLNVIGNASDFHYLLAPLPGDSYRLNGRLPRRDFLRELGSADVVVIPSRYEPLGLLALEAMALGIPVIANNTGGFSELIRDQHTGLLVPTSDGSFGLYLAMKDLVENPERRYRMGRAGRQSVDGRFSMERVLEDMEKQFGRATLTNRFQSQQLKLLKTEGL